MERTCVCGVCGSFLGAAFGLGVRRPGLFRGSFQMIPRGGAGGRGRSRVCSGLPFFPHDPLARKQQSAVTRLPRQTLTRLPEPHGSEPGLSPDRRLCPFPRPAWSWTPRPVGAHVFLSGAPSPLRPLLRAIEQCGFGFVFSSGQRNWRLVFNCSPWVATRRELSGSGFLFFFFS